MVVRENEADSSHIVEHHVPCLLITSIPICNVLFLFYCIMGTHCVAYGCNSKQKPDGGRYSFHRFPHNRPEILSKWIIAVKRKNWKPTRYSRLCSKHFTEDCYQVRPDAERKLLKEDAVPSIFDFPSHLIKKKSSRRILDRSALDSSTSTFIVKNEISQDTDIERYDNSNGSSEIQSSTSTFIVKNEISQDIDIERYDNSNGSSEIQSSTSTFIVKNEISQDIDIERYDKSNGSSEIQSSTSTFIVKNEISQDIDIERYDNSNGSSEIQSSTSTFIVKNEISQDIDIERYDNSNGSSEVQSSTSTFIVKSYTPVTQEEEEIYSKFTRLNDRISAHLYEQNEISQDIDIEKYDNSNGSSEVQSSNSIFITQNEISQDTDMEKYDNSNGRSEAQSSNSTFTTQNEISQALDMGRYDNSNGSNEVQSSRVVALNKKVKNLQSELRRRKMKIKSMKGFIDNLKSGCMTNNLQEILENYFSGFPLAILIYHLKNKTYPSCIRYSPIVKEFALTLYFQSPIAFRYVRQLWNLPHPSRIRKWIASVKCHPGFLGEVFSYLKQEIDNMPYLRDCALMFHSMPIKKQISYNASLGKCVGYIDLGGIDDIDPEELATEALVFMIISLSGNFKCPIAYFFVSDISASLQAQIIKVCLERLSEVGISIHSLTCDGTAANIQTLKHLGCKICVENLDSLKSSFKHPITGTDIAVFLDPYYLLKLARETLADKGMISSEIGDVKWEYIVKLNRLQEQEQLKFSSKLSRTHVYFWNKKQNIKLAAETLSSGVADALHYLLKMKHPDFQGCEATIEFIRILNQLFDILNTRNPFGKGFKQPLRMENKKYFNFIFEQYIKYLTSLSVNGSAIILHPRKTFMLGFAICIKSAQLLITQLSKKNSNVWKYLLLYKTSQDHLELFFSYIRARANNNKPNIDQFRWAVRKLLFCKNICVANFNSGQYSIFEFRSIQRCFSDDDSVLSNDTELEAIMSHIDSQYLSENLENIFIYIAGCIIKKLMRNLTCDRCCNILVKFPFESDKIYASSSYFINCINRRGLVFKSDGVIEIIKYAEKSFRLFMIQHGIMKNLISKRIARFVIQHFSQPENYRKLQQWGFCHAIMAEISCEDLHETQLIRKITEIYIEIRLHSYRKQSSSLMMQGNVASVRQKLNNAILFSNV